MYTIGNIDRQRWFPKKAERHPVPASPCRRVAASLKMPVSLHTHSWYSFLEGASGLEALLARAAACSYPTLALTDTNNLYGAVAFVNLAQQYGVRPLLGACLRQQRCRCVTLVADRTGYRSLCRILSRLNMGRGDTETPVEVTRRRGDAETRRSGDGHRVAASPCPRVGSLADLLAENPEGLHVLVDDVKLAERLRDVFGPRLWLEVVRPPRLVRQNRELLEWGTRLGLRPIASTAAHFALPADYPAFRLITAVRQTTLLDQLPARMPITPDHHLVDLDTLRHRFHDLPEAVHNTDVLAEQLSSDVLPREVILPPPRVPRQFDAAGFLRALCEQGLRRRFPLHPLSPRGREDLAARQRLQRELAVIEAANLEGYFLVVRDIARYAQRKGYGMALRGSAGNSLVCYLLGITDVDPLRFGLPMERFLHPGREDLPDIDLDFDWKVRDDVIAYVFRRYGPQHTAMISSHLFLQPRSAFREAAKVHGLSTEQVSRLAETVGEQVDGFLEATRRRGDAETRRQEDQEMGNGDGRRVAVSPCPCVVCPRGFPLEPERWPRILADARLLLGRPHHLCVHPGGVVITPGPIEDHVPLQRAPKGVVITQFEKDAVEQTGLVKIDLLGNRALSTVDEATRVATTRRRGDGETRRQEDWQLIYKNGDSRRVAEEAAVALLRRGDTLGINQLESPAMRHLLVQMKAERLDDIIQALALIRPGAASIGAKEAFVRRRRSLEREHRGRVCDIQGRSSYRLGIGRPN